MKQPNISHQLSHWQMVAELIEHNKPYCFQKKNFGPCDFIYLYCTKNSGLQSQKKTTMKCTAIFRTPTVTFLSWHSFAKVFWTTAQLNTFHMPTKTASTLQLICIRWLSTYSFSQITAVTTECSYQLAYIHKTKQYLPKLRNIMALLFCVYTHTHLTSKAKHWRTEKFFWFLPSFM
jgi:hypothetical protein